ncbi:monooxygenase 2-like [Salvia miltiorrhiza]|uniref:monooxygenase 2-like n=1 Tax=Salvia miltiorrhiza TaxID=226208 RepID=UPI0025ACB5B2|nr:monooxygenase 2-like [Salvia miltiorrhiza]
MEATIHEQDILIVGGGIAGLTTALGLHRLGIRSLVLEASDGLRTTGFALTMWTNAWIALDAVGIGDAMRADSLPIQGFEVGSLDSTSSSPEQGVETDFKLGKFESRCVRRTDLLELLERELPQGSVRYSSKIVCIEESGNFKLVHLSDGSIFRTKVLLGCDGVNSMVAQWLGLKSPVSAARAAIRGYVVYPDGHGFEPKLYAYFGGGVRIGFVPCDGKGIYWFCTFTPSLFKYDESERDPSKMKQFVISKIGRARKHVMDVVERTELANISSAHLKFRSPWNILFGDIVRNGVCVAGDALHPMTPDLGQGGCSAIEDAVVLARCLGGALSEEGDEEDCAKMAKGLERYGKERRWRSFSLVSTAYVVGKLQESDNKVVSFFRKMFLSKFTVEPFVRMADFDCGKLVVASN